jgi:outer membrane protein assembly factor BamB
MAVCAFTKSSSISRLVPAVASLLALAMLSPSSALITEQQLGAVDWHRQYLGRVTDAVFAPANRPRVYVASEPGAIAALNLRNGSIVWRQVCLDLEHRRRRLGPSLRIRRVW